MTENLNNGNKYSAKLIAKMGMMAAIACVLGLFRFPILPMVPFLTYDFADIPIIISAFAFGPVAGILITLIVSFIQAFLLGGDQLYGFIMHVISSGAFVLIASLIYQRNKTKKTAIIGLVVAMIVTIILMGFANYFITPYYYGGEGMRQAVVQLMPFILLFNLIKWAGNSVITLLIYKRISPFLNRTDRRGDRTGGGARHCRCADRGSGHGQNDPDQIHCQRAGRHRDRDQPHF